MTTCKICGLSHQCVCELIPSLESQAHIALLTHENELTRDTNTGRWAVKMLSHCQTHIWQRKLPPSALISQIESGDYTPLLLFPAEESQQLSGEKIAVMAKPPLFIVLDATWQEARKMLNKSPWLQALSKVCLNTERPSSYQLRRNQAQGNLCTLEVVAELLALCGDNHDAQQITPFLEHYTKVFKADKSGHAYCG
ncbi:tRNA-uridine aminocarboxypropyltransferase [Vibrio agarivorans]|uniref:tRNA-uridine aminocarboxypropyltransferase n=1 Tax=Vibrio agarivorans TaxID=153622 RepID=UPI0025B41B13|nr:DTW domain-containing protein [Vibrio agarivorans]MDN3661894.1 DTW domain-containing protein [Vibrio agarivorans]